MASRESGFMHGCYSKAEHRFVTDGLSFGCIKRQCFLGRMVMHRLKAPNPMKIFPVCAIEASDWIKLRQNRIVIGRTASIRVG